MEKARAFRLALICAVAAAAIGVFVGYFSVFVPFLIAMLVAYLLDPLVGMLERCRWKCSRGAATAIVFLGFLAAAVGLVMVLYPVFASGVTLLSQTIAGNEKQIKEAAASVIGWIEKVNLPLNIDKAKLMADVSAWVQGFLGSFFTDLSRLALSILGSIPLLLIIPLLIFYFLKDKPKVFAVLRKYTADEKEAKFKALFASINSQLGGYVRGQVILSLSVAVITTVAMFLFGIQYAVLIGLANGVLNIIPYFGPVLGAIPGIVLALIYFQSTGHLVGVIVFFVVMNIVVAAFLSPKIFSSATNLHPIFVILAIFLGSTAFGMMGMVFAIPLAIIVKTVITVVFEQYIGEI